MYLVKKPKPRIAENIVFTVKVTDSSIKKH